MRTLLPDARPTRRQSTILASMTLALGLLASSSGCMALGLRVESSSTGCGAALVVFGVRANVLTELASGPYVGAPFR